jgi:predicted nuclease of predicted toxin-antitoxin system
VKFLVDECLPARLAARLGDLGHDAMHVADLDLLGATDEQVMAAAAADGRVLISVDTDFGELLAIGKLVAASVILLRGMVAGADYRFRVLADNLEQVEDDLRTGAIVVISGDRVRVRGLPLGG